MSDKLRVLIVEDVPTDAELMECELQDAGIAFSAKRVETKEAYIEALSTFLPDIILSDYSLPAFDGIATLQLALKRAPDTPFIFVTGALGEELAVDLLKQGATDYVLKSRLSRLSVTVKRALREVEERKERERALRDLNESEERHLVTLQTAMDGFFRADMQGRILEVNENYCRMSGYSEQELLTMTITDIEAMHSAETIGANLRRFAELGPNRFESVHRRKDGSLFNVEISGQYQPIVGGQAVVFVRDITERKRAEDHLRYTAEALRRSEAYLAEAERLSHTGSWAFDLANNKYIYVSEECIRIFGLDAQEALPDREAISRLIHPEDWDRVNRDFEKSLREKVDVSSEFRIALPSGAAKHIQASRHPVLNSAGDVVKIVGTVIDITERKCAEEALRQSEAYLAEAQRLSHTGSWAFDVASDKYVYISDECSRIFGLDPQEGLPTREAVSRRIHPEDWERVSGDFEKLIREKVAASSEFRIVLPDGTVKHTLVTRHPLPNDAGDVVKIVGTVIDITERKRAEEEIKKTEERFRMLIETMNEGFGVRNEKGVWTYANDQLCWMLGHLPGNIIGHPVTEFLDEANQSVLGEEIQRERKGNYSPYEITWTREDGRKVTTIVSPKPIFNLGSQVKEVFAVFTDITERKQAEDRLRHTIEALRRSETYLAEAQRLSRTGSWARSPAGEDYDYWSEETFRIWGFDPQQPRPTYSTLADRIHPEDRDRVLEIIETARRERKDYDVQLRIVLPDQAIKHIHIIGHNVFSESGELITRIGTVVDITERKRAEAEINSLKNYLSNIIDSMPSILVGMDTTRTVTQWNRQAEAFTGIPAGEAIGKPIVDLLPDFTTWIMIMRADMDEHRPSSMEKLLVAKGGERRFYDLMLYPLLIDTVGGAVLRIEDVTERARIQELMVQTEKMMSIGGLASGMAHEINNPLGIITQAAQNIERRISLELHANRKVCEELGLNLEGIRAYFDKRQISDAIASIRTASSRAAKIIANILQFSRRADITMQPASLAQIVDQALELAASDYDLKKSYDFRSIDIIKDYQDIPQVPIVSVEIEQVILNLLRNAAQAMTANPPDRRPRITLRLRCDGRYAVLEVEDNGPGMTENILAKVFEPFFTTKEPGMGTGLGLSVSYIIVTQNHKGFMEVQSTPGRGALFRVRLPLGGSET